MFRISIRKEGNRIRVTAQLINCNDGYHIWSQQYDRELDGVFEVQEDISSRIAEKLQATLVRGRSTQIRPASVEAYEAVLQGNYHQNKDIP